ncbi:MAG: formate dehydrogenase subunit gamma [Rhodocyclaceae bacterium]|nr:formate dehydrogenase subunit gamma [Rhodocyclaceae bacterium]
MKRTIVRYQDSTRINHWFVALLFVFAGLSGLALFHPSMFFFSNLFGGGSWTRILHPYFGLLMVFGFVFLFLQVWRENIWTRNDTEWIRNSEKLLRGDEEHMPPVGKYNAGQKAVVWVFAVSLLVLLITGFMFWRPWFDGVFPIVLQRVAVLLHALAAFALVLSVIIHVYAAIWVKGSVRAMTRGTVTEGWARRHHPLWYKEMRGEK